MCVDFTDLNKGYAKDSFPLSWIELIVDARVKHKVLGFMDAYSGYNH